MDLGIIDVAAVSSGAQLPATVPGWAEDAFRGLGTDVEDEIAEMDSVGTAMRLCLALQRGAPGRAGSFSVTHADVAQRVAQSSSRLRGIWGYGPGDGWRGARAFAAAVEHDGFVGAHVAPSSFDVAPDDRRLYPIYAKCAEIDRPVMIDVGSRRLGRDEPRTRDLDRPQTLDVIACDFPSLEIVAIGTGWPWAEELVAVANKHAGISIALTGPDPALWPVPVVHFARSWGVEKVMVASIGSPDRRAFLRDVRAVELPEAARVALLRGAAGRVFPSTREGGS
jgi:uncharacterized protein